MTIVLRAVVLVLLLGVADMAFAAASSAPGQPLRLAYLDPGSGSFIVQALIAMFAGIIVTSKMYWSKIKSFLGIESPVLDDDEDEDDV